jgi:hypothetical protein
MEPNFPVIPKGILAKTPKARHKDELRTFDPLRLKQMDDRSLAEWQSQFEQSEGQWRLAEHEWQRRAGVNTRRIALAALGVSIFSLIWTAWVYWHPRR